MAVIQYFQKLGFGIKDITKLTREKKETLQRELEEHRDQLTGRKAELESLIGTTNKVIEAVGNGNSDFLEVIYEIIKEV